MSRPALSPRLAIATCTAPVAGLGAAGAVAAALMGCVDEMCGRHLIGYGAIFGAMLGLALGWPTMLLVGLPLHGWLLRRAHTGALGYVLAGAVAGLAPALALEAFASLVAGSFEDRPQPAVLIFAMGTGAFCGLLFWLIRRPDRDSPNPPTSAP